MTASRTPPVLALENSSGRHLTPGSPAVGPDLYFALALTLPQCRCESLAELNTQLRLHMEKADVVNKALREDVEKLTVDWSQARDELIRKENQWRMEQEVGGTGAGTVRGGLVLWALPWSVLEGVYLRTWMETGLSLKSLTFLTTHAGS